MYHVASPPNVGACTGTCSTALGTGSWPAICGRAGADDGRGGRTSTGCRAASRARRSGCWSRWAWWPRAAGSASPSSRGQLECLRPAADSLAPRPATAQRSCCRSPSCGGASSRSPRRWPPSAPTRISAGSWPRPSPTWWCTAVGRPRGLPARGQDLSPHAAGGQRQRDVPGAQRRGRRGAGRAHPSRHDAGDPEPEAIDLHDEVARAIRIGDEAAAERAMRAIIDEAADAVQQEFSDRPANS